MNGPSYSTSYIDGTYTPGIVASSRSTRLARRAPPDRRFHAPTHLGDLADDLLAVADHERVDEVGQRLGVERAVPAGEDERVRRGGGRSLRTGTPARSRQFRRFV